MQYIHETYEYILQLYGLFIYLKSFKSSLDDKLNPYIFFIFYLASCTRIFMALNIGDNTRAKKKTHYMKLAAYAMKFGLSLDYDQAYNLVKNMKQTTNDKLKKLDLSGFGNDDEDPNRLAKAQLTRSEEIIARLMNPSGNYSYKVRLTFYDLYIYFLN